MKRNAIVLAAGKGTRMKSKLYKVLHPVLGKPMVQHVVDNLKRSNTDNLIIVVGHGSEDVKKSLGEDVTYVLQSKQLGTGHAVMMVDEILSNEPGNTIIICGDTPLISSETIEQLFSYHEENNASATILTAINEYPKGYGRIIRNGNKVEKIVEHKDANEEQLLVKEINTGTYVFDNITLFKALKNIDKNNSQGEYYLTDVIEIIKNMNKKVVAYVTDEFSEILGVNDRVALSNAERYLKRKINEKLMREGVSIINPDNTYISVDTVIGRDTVIYPGTIIYGNNTIGEDCIIGPNTQLENVDIGNRTKIKQSVITDSSVGSDTNVGPFAHFRNKAIIGDSVRIGNFVEIKNSTFGNNSNAAHLAYMGDSEIGKNVNMGCGIITVNYDGFRKHKTVVKDNAFIGCNSNLIAPVTINEGSIIAAGTTVTNEVPENSLAIGREKQINKVGYAKKIRNRQK